MLNVRYLPGRCAGLLCALLLLAACGQNSAGAKATGMPTATTIPATPALTATPLPALSPAQYQQIIDGLTPVSLSISSIGVTSPILPVGTNAQGAMIVYNDAAANDPIWDNVYLSEAGSLPGQPGNAVIAGHVNRPTPDPAPFTNLAKLAIGNEVAVTTKNGTRLVFKVTAMDLVPESANGSDLAIDRIFGPASTPNLNLITCAGFDGKSFRQRFVVYTVLEGPSPFPAMQGIMTP